MFYDLHADLLRLRREDKVLSTQGRDGIDGAVLGAECFVIRFFSPNHAADRLLVVNLGEKELEPVPEPLLAAPNAGGWRIAWSSENPKYGGNGVAKINRRERLVAPGACGGAAGWRWRGDIEVN